MHNSLVPVPARLLVYCRTSPTIVNFWSVIHELSEAQKKLFLSFVTGSDRVPIKVIRCQGCPPPLPPPAPPKRLSLDCGGRQH